MTMKKCEIRMPRWDTKLTSKFMNEYELRDCLWNQNSQYFKHRDFRKMAYKGIADAMNLPNFGVTEVRNKIKNLRSTYGQESKKIIYRRSRGREYTPTIKWFHTMKRIVENNVDSTTELIVKDDLPDDLMKELNEEYTIKDEHDLPEELMNELKEDYTIDIHNLELVENTNDDDEEDITAKRSKPDNNGVPTITSTSSSSGAEDEFYHFGTNVAAQLREMPLEKALEAQVQIMTILAKTRLTSTAADVI